MTEQLVALFALVAAGMVVWAIHKVITTHEPHGRFSEKKTILWLECAAFVCLLAAFSTNHVIHLIDGKAGDLLHDGLLIMGALFASLLIYRVFTFKPR
ncbi:MAG TPA: hypothetical protein VI485_03465 [Vicinamibacterales bacterium]|nr:hypothetical protein [Vicinamibacterales bacterium]